MPPRRALLAAASFAVLLAACGSGDATQASVRDDVKASLLERPENDLSDEEAAAVGDCVAEGMFASADFTPEERNEATRAADGDPPDPELAAKVQDLVDRCLTDPDSEE